MLAAAIIYRLVRIADNGIHCDYLRRPRSMSY
jgi:hypothetical protein